MPSLSSWVVLLVPVSKHCKSGKIFLTVLKLQKNPPSACNARLSATTIAIVPLKCEFSLRKLFQYLLFPVFLCPRLMAEVMTHTLTYQLILMEIIIPIVYLLSVIDILLGYFSVQSKMLRFFYFFILFLNGFDTPKSSWYKINYKDYGKLLKSSFFWLSPEWTYLLYQFTSFGHHKCIVVHLHVATKFLWMTKLVHTGLRLACRFHGQNQPLFLLAQYSFFVTWSSLTKPFPLKVLNKGTFWMQYFCSFKIKHTTVKWLISLKRFFYGFCKCIALYSENVYNKFTYFTCSSCCNIKIFPEI